MVSKFIHEPIPLLYTQTPNNVTEWNIRYPILTQIGRYKQMLVKFQNIFISWKYVKRCSRLASLVKTDGQTNFNRHSAWMRRWLKELHTYLKFEKSRRSENKTKQSKDSKTNCHNTRNFNVNKCLFEMYPPRLAENLSTALTVTSVKLHAEMYIKSQTSEGMFIY